MEDNLDFVNYKQFVTYLAAVVGHFASEHGLHFRRVRLLLFR